jgi:hypothetical protein
LAEANRWTALWQFSEPKRRTLFARTEERGMGMATFSWACCHEADRCEAAAHAMHEDEAPKEVIMTVLQQREEALRQGRYMYSLAVSVLFSLFRSLALSRSRSPSLVYPSLSHVFSLTPIHSLSLPPPLSSYLAARRYIEREGREPERLEMLMQGRFFEEAATMAFSAGPVEWAEEALRALQLLGTHTPRLSAEALGQGAIIFLFVYRLYYE